MMSLEVYFESLSLSLFLSWSLSFLPFSTLSLQHFSLFTPSFKPSFLVLRPLFSSTELFKVLLFVFYHFFLEITVNYINTNGRETRCDAWAEAREGLCQYWFIVPLTLERPWMLIWLSVETKAGLLLSNLNSVSSFEDSFIPSDPFDFSYWVLFLSIPTKGFLS